MQIRLSKIRTVIKNADHSDSIDMIMKMSRAYGLTMSEAAEKFNKIAEARNRNIHKFHFCQLTSIIHPERDMHKYAYGGFISSSEIGRYARLCLECKVARHRQEVGVFIWPYTSKVQIDGFICNDCITATQPVFKTELQKVLSQGSKDAERSGSGKIDVPKFIRAV